MRVYQITEAQIRDCGYTGDADFSLRLKGDSVEYVDCMTEADAYLLPIPIREKELPEALLARVLETYSIPQERLVAFDCSDFEAQYPAIKNCLFIRCNLKGWMRRMMPRSIAWPWPVEDFGDITAIPEGGFKYDVSAHMWLSSNVRHYACDSVSKTPSLKADVVTRSEFYGYIERDEPDRAKGLKAAFKKSMHESRLALCPSSIPNVFPYRFFEAMSAARVPVLFCDDYSLPWGQEVPYREFCLLLSDSDASQAGPIIREWLNTKSDQDLIEMGKKGRQYFLEYLNRDNWSELFAKAIEKSLRKDGLIE